MEAASISEALYHAAYNKLELTVVPKADVVLHKDDVQNLLLSKFPEAIRVFPNESKDGEFYTRFKTRR